MLVLYIKCYKSWPPFDNILCYPDTSFTWDDIDIRDEKRWLMLVMLVFFSTMLPRLPFCSPPSWLDWVERLLL